MRKITMACGFAVLVALAPVMGARAADLCGAMLMPAAQLKQVSRGVGRGHTGLDLTAPYGSPVRAALGGTVIFAGRYYAYGNMIDIRHADGMTTRYAHLAAFAAGIRPGAMVATGGLLGAVGTTGNAHGAHLHFEVRIDGKVIDPRPYLGLAACATVPHAPNEIVEEARAPDHVRRQVRPK